MAAQFNLLAEIRADSSGCSCGPHGDFVNGLQEAIAFHSGLAPPMCVLPTCFSINFLWLAGVGSGGSRREEERGRKKEEAEEEEEEPVGVGWEHLTQGAWLGRGAGVDYEELRLCNQKLLITDSLSKLYPLTKFH